VLNKKKSYAAKPSRCGLSDEQLVLLVDKILEKNPHDAITLDLADNNLTDKSLPTLLKLLQIKKVSLMLEGNNFTNATLLALIQSSKLLSLNMSRNNLKLDQVFCSTVAAANTGIPLSFVHGNSIVDGSSAESLLKLLKPSASLKN